MNVPAFVDKLPSKWASAFRFLFTHDNAVIFVAGFLFDMITITRIDSWVDISIQFF